MRNCAVLLAPALAVATLSSALSDGPQPQRRPNAAVTVLEPTKVREALEGGRQRPHRHTTRRAEDDGSSRALV